jgi:hypothetical protein
MVKEAERKRIQKAENRANYRRKLDLAKTVDGDLLVGDLEDEKDYRSNEVVTIYEGLIQVRKLKKDSVEDDFKIKKGGGEKKKITTFSKRSRSNMMQHLGMNKCMPEFWHDLTYPDDVMEGLTQEERRLKSSEDLHQLNRWMEREGIDPNGDWKREWKIRKSGILKGSFMPHFHNIFWLKNANNKKYLQIYFRIAEKWLQLIGTRGEYLERARKVLYHEKSYRFIESQKQMRKYMQKYISKDEGFDSSESIGRSWGLIGNPIEENPEKIEINNNEMVLLKRMLRKLCKELNKKVKYGLNFCLSHQWTQFFVLMEKQTVFRMIELIRSGTLAEGFSL